MLKSKIKIKNKIIGKGYRPYIIAEMACAHNGSTKTALKLIDAAAKANADAIQLQFFKAENTVTPHHEVYQALLDIEFKDNEWTELVDYSVEQGLDVFVCTYDKPSIELAVTLGVDGIKLNSADISNPEVLGGVAESGIPFTLGTGASSLEEIAEALSLAIERGAENVIIMHGVQNFPTNIEDLNISRIDLLQDVFEGIPVGYADHTDGGRHFAHKVDLVAIGLGANVLEKHITIERAEKGLDYEAALEPDEFKKYVETIRKGYSAYGSKKIKPFTKSELSYRKFQKKSIVAACEIEKGSIITKDDVVFLRNNEPGISPNKLDTILNRKTSRYINKYENIIERYLL